eukprot:TRINITY_DN63997_c0_g2_i1.p1 TRINITY_DN63997_c0_g2~~TRINITY_DN63997_c0_g2_i1.p1  ORF type:complete len:468 (-),score=49.98 TRINITY_DN63997_c0_g2_i1:1231-2634(-)
MTDSPTLSNPDEDQFSDTEEEPKDRADLKKALSQDRPETPEWMDNTQHILSEAQQCKVISSVLREESSELRNLLERQQHDSTKNVNEQLKKKIADTTALKTKLEKRVQALAAEYESLQRLRMVAAQQLAAREGPLQIAERRVRIRSQRPQREQIYDSVERALQTEYRDLRNAVDQLTSCIEAADAHLQKMEHMEKQLQMDIDDKNMAIQLDQDCLDLVVNPDKPLQLGGGIPKLEATDAPRRSQGVPELWKKETDQLLDEALKLEQMGIRMKKNLKSLITQIREANTQSNNLSNGALKKKLAQGTKLHASLSHHLQEITEEIDQLEATKSALNAAMKQREKPLGTVQRRLAIRQQRPQREAVRDTVEEALENELAAINSTMTAIMKKTETIDKELKRLQQAKNCLLDDLHDKTQSLKLDKNCMEIISDTELSVTQNRAEFSGTLPPMGSGGTVSHNSPTRRQPHTAR